MKIDAKRLRRNQWNNNITENRTFNKLTIIAHEEIWKNNLKRNAKSHFFRNAKSIPEIEKQVGTGKKILIVGAGYSLEGKVDEIRRIQSLGGIIFATDAATKYLYDREIYPEYIFQLDSKKIGVRFFEGIEDKLFRSSLVTSSAVDKEFFQFFPHFKEIFSFHMYDPSIPEWGGNTHEPIIMGDVGIVFKGQDYQAKTLLPNLEYVLNKGNVFNLALQVAGACHPDAIYGYGTEHAYQIENGNVFTRARIRDDTDKLDYSIGGERIPFHKIRVVFRQNDNKLFYSEVAFLGYAKNANEIIANMKLPYVDRSDGLVMSTKEFEDEEIG